MIHATVDPSERGSVHAPFSRAPGTLLLKADYSAYTHRGHASKRPRSPLHQYCPHLGHGRGSESRVRSSWNADGARTTRIRPIHANDAPRPVRPKLAEPGPLRALVRARLDAALRLPVPQ